MASLGRILMFFIPETMVFGRILVFGWSYGPL